jgi:hypothetical protein
MFHPRINVQVPIDMGREKKRKQRGLVRGHVKIWLGHRMAWKIEEKGEVKGCEM